jgi:PBP1b-binding outer membrane lipoprotein LpoB
MRALLLIAGVALALGGCGNNDQTDKTQNADENLTAENIVSNDVTAIDAVTGDAANMAADVDTNYGGLDENAATASNSDVSAKSSKLAKPAVKKPAPAPEANSSAATTANAQ